MEELSCVLTQDFVSCVHVRFYFSLPLIFALLAANISHCLTAALNFHVFLPTKFVSFVFNYSLLLFLSNNVKKDTTLLLFFLSKSLGSHAIFFPNKTLSYIWVAIPVDWIILHWYVCGAGGRSGGRCTVTWLPNFLGWAVYHISLPMLLRCARFARESSAMMMMTWVPRGMRIHQDRREPCMQY